MGKLVVLSQALMRPFAGAAGFTLCILVCALCAKASDDQAALRQQPQHRALLQTIDSARCMPQIRQIARRCQAKPKPGAAPGPTLREALIRAIQQCLFADQSTNQTRAIRVLTLASQAATLLNNSSSVFASMANLTLAWDKPASVVEYNEKRVTSLTQPGAYNGTHEAWILTPSAIGLGVAHNSFMNLSDLVLLDQRLQWLGLLPALRLSGLLYKSKVVALPLSSYSLHLYYAKDVFQANGWELPRTWWDLVHLAQRINGTDGRYGLCGDWCGYLNVAVLRHTLASYHQTQGSTHGWAVDPSTSNVLLGSPAMTESIHILRALQAVSPPDQQLHPGCASQQDTFEMGQCLVGLSYPTAFKSTSHKSRVGPSNPLYGNLGVAQLPGSSQVLDRATNTLVPCTEANCPYANRYTDDDGRMYWVNTSPGFDADVMAINGQAEPETAFFAFNLISYMASSVVLNSLVYQPDADVFPSRGSHLDPETWADAGYHDQDAAEYCSAHAASFSHPNIHAQVRSSTAAQLLDVLTETATAALLTGTTAAQLAGYALAKANAIIDNAFNGNRTAFQLDYASSLNWKPLAADNQPRDVQGSAGNNERLNSRLAVILGLLAPITLLLSIGGFIARKSFLHRQSHQAYGHGKDEDTSDYPRAGPTTTLLITDVENSTAMWEDVASDVMDKAMRLHDTCLRQLAAERNGYETVWEGDSFVIVFSSPDTALKFALKAQQRLLAQSWPAALLRSSYAAPVWVRRSFPSSLSDTPASASIRTSPQLKRVSKTWKGSTPGSSRLGSLTSIRENNAPSKPSNSGAKTGRISFAGRISFGGISVGRPRSRSTSYAGSVRAIVHSTFSVDDDNMAADGDSVAAEAGSTGRRSEGGFAINDSDTWGQEQQKQWIVCDRRAAGACCAYNGLRVRIGFHAGVCDSDLSYNNIVKRWRYSGLVRAIASAVVTAGHGGQVLVSGSTASLFEASSGADALHHLPTDCSLFYMGHFQLDDVPDAQDLLCVLPNSLVCRMAIQQDALRNTDCLLQGVLTAPLPCSPKAGVCRPVLVGVQLLWLDVLRAWDKQQADAAVSTVSQFVIQKLSMLHGHISEDGWRITSNSGNSNYYEPANLRYSQRRKSSSLLHMPTPPLTLESRGRMTMAFSDANSAIMFALHMYSDIPCLDWSDELLGHPICGNQVEADAASYYHGWLLCDWKEIASERSILGSHSGLSFEHRHASFSVSQLSYPALSNLASVKRRASAAAFLPQDLNHSLFPCPDADQAMLKPEEAVPSPCKGHRDSCNQDSAGFSWDAAHNAHTAELGDRHTDPQCYHRRSTFIEVLPVPEVPKSPSINSRLGVGRTSRARRSSLSFVQSMRPSHAEDQELRSSVHQQDKQKLANIRVLHACASGGLQFKVAVASGALSVDVATRTSGRVVYTGPGEQLLRRLINLAGPGQIASTLPVLQEGLQG